MKKDSLLFVHGVCHGSWCWEMNFVPYFQKLGYDCHAISLSGHETPGSTASIHRLSLLDYVKDVEEAVRKIGRPPIIIGHSMGGLVVQKYLENASCKKAILLASVPPSGAWMASLRFMLNHPASIIDLLRLNLYAAFYKNARALLYGELLSEEVVRGYRDKMCAESFRAFLQLLFPRIRKRNLSDVSMLVIGAENDQVFTQREVEATGEFYEAETIIVKDIAHNMMLDRGHEKVSFLIRQWLKKQEEEQKIQINGA